MSDEILWSVEDGGATVTLNRPEKRNAINQAMIDELSDGFARLETDPDVRVIVIRAEGPVFSSGRDLREMRARQEGGGTDRGVAPLFEQIERSRHPTIAAVQGDALAGGCELALHCDFRIASEAARFGMTLARLGLVAPYPLALKIVEIVGPAFARQILLTGEPITARRAYEIGMVHELVAPEELAAAAATLARTIAANAPLSLAGMKAVIERAISLPRTAGHDDLDEMARRARASADAREGVQAWLERRLPVFRGE